MVKKQVPFQQGSGTPSRWPKWFPYNISLPFRLPVITLIPLPEVSGPFGVQLPTHKRLVVWFPIP